MTRRRHAGVTVGLAMLVLGGAVAAGQPRAGQRVPTDDGRSYTNVSATGLAGMLQQKAFLLVNVHVPYEGELASTDLFIPFDRMTANVGRLPADRSARIVLYCRSGHMSAIAARTLVSLGYTDVWNLDGGMIAWEDAGYRLVRKSR